MSKLSQNTKTMQDDLNQAKHMNGDAGSIDRGM
jgi:hypothetical protein